MRAEPPARIRPYKTPCLWLALGSARTSSSTRMAIPAPEAAEKEMTENLTCEGKCWRALRRP
jgi:hypothetical protein